MVGAVPFKPNFNLHFSCVSCQHRSHLPLKPKTKLVRITNPHPYWASLQAEIEAHIKQAIPIKEPLVVFEPMHHLVFAAPPTTAPALCLAACELVGGQRHQAMAAASALLLLQAATHTRENLLPADGSEPEPKPRVNGAYGPNIELLTGDGIAPFGFELLARSDDPAQGNSERVLRVMIEISRAVGSEGVINAQYMEARSDGEELRHVESMKRVVEKNEGGLHACAAACGAVLGGGSEEEIDMLRKYGFHVGMFHGLRQRGFNEHVYEVRNQALHQLQFFKDRDLYAISSFIHF
ncbi:heterodimeric geranylgeranyl pyrophosphate synthase small subunit, chloroplastic-like [Abrus precatorius]|uniref:Heterodimeric geranylgeranyl pyrophosphate synthase small subunit, chloroplastic-like n=1 Tax=Abrus precatorius TaxID=3816 RepID=A0A8B8JMN4_ABRPR|nr:heterodimeric geranylgeranyl pyrophosphate synthase small subunit, chloroplastic-like [Abrus precatorius]